MLPTDSRIGFAVLKVYIARGITTNEIFFAAFKEFKGTSTIKFLRKPFEEERNLSRFPTVLFNGSNKLEIGLWLSTGHQTGDALISSRGARKDRRSMWSSTGSMIHVWRTISGDGIWRLSTWVN